MPGYLLVSRSIRGTVGVWTDVTPGGIDLADSSNGGDNFGVQDVLADSSVAGAFYVFTCYNGVYESTNYGLTWTKVSGSSALDFGKAWGSAIAPDGSYMLASLGNSTEGSPEGRRCMFRSTDKGRTWTRSADVGFDPYNADVCAFDSTKVLIASHDNDHVGYSSDSGVTWTDTGAVGAGGTGGYVQFLHDSSTAIYVGQDTEDVYRGTRSGSSWTWGAIADLANAGHAHGVHQMYYDASNSAFYHPAGANNGQDGIWRSTNNGVNWTRVYSTELESAIAATATTMYSMRSFPVGSASYDPKFTTALRSAGTSWAVATSPSGMTNGAKRFATGTDGTNWVVIAGCWNGGIWRYRES
jgi:hypothetical protein